ncbi:carbohydrate kinase family protein [Hoeflea prorocentri]|uniref:Carbohydrate kinase family protein n=1 Tax=Hoeflea prorocentri TaxID=1922333 RepID=A0A9X3UF89_9HYPH|nr:carbohydrate kinase family protein [Hoeflea prorocentri]MCY6380192.1 carbohydrate kinase family protein [Hoeflea prorocentri]MDA5397992.1 carbohydrate kinase family protein [Hoeflea prorocentri]
MSTLVVTGYASLDYVMGLSGQIAGDRTTIADHRDPDAWPRLGGCPAYVAMAAANAGETAYAVTWIGGGADGKFYTNQLYDNDVRIDGVAMLDGRPTPSAVLAYQADGTCACLFDPALAGEERLNQAQRDLIRASTHLCISVGPPHLMQEILSLRPDGARLYCVLKSDLNCFTPAVLEALSPQADVIFCNASERSLIGKVGSSAIVVETNGPNGVRVCGQGIDTVVPVSAVDARDTTGAGDTLAGAYIAAEMSGQTNPVAAATTGIEEVAALLRQRLSRRRL